MRYLSVCSGIEAATVAWHPLGWTPAGFSEIEPFPRAVLEQRHGAVACDFDHRWAGGQNFAPLFGDFTQIEEHHVGPVDLLVGGTPCQAFSVAGKRLGLDDPRGNLTIEFFRLAKRLRARWVVWENVPGVLSNWSGEPDCGSRTGGRITWTETSDFAAILSLFHECGYRGGWRVLDAQYVRVDGFGRAVPQRRRRVFLVGHLGNDARAIPVLFDPESLRGLDQPRRTAGQGSAATPCGDPASDRCAGQKGSMIPSGAAATFRPFGADGSGGPAGDECQNLVAVAVAPTLQAGGKTTGGHRSPGTSVDTVETLVAVRAGDVAGTLKACAGKSGAPNGAEELDRMVAVAVDVAPTLSARTRGGGGLGTDAEVDGAIIAVPFDTTQITSPQSGSNPRVGDPCHTLSAAAHPPSVAYAIQERAVSENPAVGPQGKGWQENIAYTLEARHHVQAAAFQEAFNGDVAPTITSNGDAHSGFRDERGLVATTVHTSGGWAVRKLTPRECERLQGFPDDYTAIQYRGKGAADGPRYKAIGNSMAVNVMRWIGMRIDLVERAVAAGGVA